MRFAVLVLELPLAKQLEQIEFSLIFTVSPVKNHWKAILYRGGRSVFYLQINQINFTNGKEGSG
jgi:hypothetical protein